MKEFKGETKSGFKYTVTMAALNNYELLEELNGLESNPLKIVRVVDLLLGTEQKKNLLEHLRDEDGTVPTEKVNNEITEIFESIKIKKS